MELKKQVDVCVVGAGCAAQLRICSHVRFDEVVR